MNTKTFVLAGASFLAIAALAVTGRGAATSRIPVGGTVATGYGAAIPVPSEYRAAARRERDDASSPSSVLLYAEGTSERAWERSTKLDDGSVLIELLPAENPAAVRARAAKAAAGPSAGLRPVEGLAYPAFASSAAGRVTVDLITPKRVVRVSAARWTSAFDAVVRGYKDEA